jgi:DNA-binding transcriptional LysR family regulator
MVEISSFQRRRDFLDLGTLEHECLMQGAEAWRFVSGGKTIAIHPQGRFKADNGEALAAAAIAGLGIAALPDFVIGSHIAAGALVPLLDDYPSPEAGLYVVRPPGASAPRKVRALIDILIERFTPEASPRDGRSL